MTYERFQRELLGPLVHTTQEPALPLISVADCSSVDDGAAVRVCGKTGSVRVSMYQGADDWTSFTVADDTGSIECMVTGAPLSVLASGVSGGLSVEGIVCVRGTERTIKVTQLGASYTFRC